jgi:hypothetical protein
MSFIKYMIPAAAVDGLAGCILFLLFGHVYMHIHSTGRQTRSFRKVKIKIKKCTKSCGENAADLFGSPVAVRKWSIGAYSRIQSDTLNSWIVQCWYFLLRYLILNQNTLISEIFFDRKTHYLAKLYGKILCEINFFSLFIKFTKRSE